ncbi:ABC transporter ATP-binding protein [Acuticoccus sp. M5D2P5]|uniref:ABC transporter ATP-binding protein n=1 Tax=Acuticoccus kalidii TaxID=2910977 RepID=UPI001F180DA2|nr:ABC transporter ATP-binding protein [Acuticoccus kalidii]MCF3934011.1 ABC transporter ATP-binding protein [Acuticoccus kalidii]
MSINRDVAVFDQYRAATKAPVLAAEHLSLGYAGASGVVAAVDDVSFKIAEGDRLVLLGPSGCGKSSILRAVAGFHTPTRGRILSRGRPIDGPGPDRVVVFQEFDQLLPWKSARENVAFPLVHARGESRRLARERADEALELVGLLRARNSYPHELSGGMKQRVAIARALAMEPDVLLMDEPFAALDALTRRKMQSDLLAVVERVGATLLFVTHSIQEAVMIGTHLHLLSPHPGRTVAEFEVTGRSDAERKSTVREVERLLVGEEVAA